jgi:cell division septal protein FtsQ
MTWVRSLLVLPRLPRLRLASARHWRRRLVVLALLAAALTAGYFFWLRDSSLVRVEQVTVKGLATTPGAPELRTQLSEAARSMTTLHLDEHKLREIASQHPVVHSIEIQPDFPHGLTITVTENEPVALVSAGDRSVPVAADGTVLEGLETDASLPTIRTETLPDERRVPGGETLHRVTAAAAAPEDVRAKIASIAVTPEHGYVAQIEKGPEVWLGGDGRLRLKWEAATAILAEESAQGASYIDVRIPERGVAGGLTITEEPQGGVEEQTQIVPEAAAPDPAAPTDPAAAAPVAPPAETPAPAPVAPTTEPQP